MEKKIQRLGKSKKWENYFLEPVLHLYTFSFLNLFRNLVSLVKRIPTPLHRNYFTKDFYSFNSYRNQSINLLGKSADWFLYNRALRHERIKNFPNYLLFSKRMEYEDLTKRFNLAKLTIQSTRSIFDIVRISTEAFPFFYCCIVVGCATNFLH